MRRHLSYANVAATLALVLAMSGGAYAASRYLIHSTRQISPKVLEELRGARGPRGVTGEIGPIGPEGQRGFEGKQGKRGEPGPQGFSATSTLPSGRSESGDFEASTPAAAAEATIDTVVSLPIPLEAPIVAEKVEVTPTTTPSANCVGPGSAARGYLCIYTASLANLTAAGAFDPEDAAAGSGRFGFGSTWKLTEGGAARVYGTYTVTAP